MSNSVVSPEFSLKKSLPPARVIITAVVLIFLAWAFFSHQTTRFYASAVFLFYGLTHSMWISVIMLGVFQTLLLIPFRIINLTKSKNIKEFEHKIKQLDNEEEQSFLIKKSAKSGRKVILYYLVDFFVQLTSFLSIGRLFLTDFYTQKLNPTYLYDFVPYPEYPLRDVWFKIPYLKIVETTDLGMNYVFASWIIIIALSIFLTWLINYLKQRSKISLESSKLSTVIGLFTGSAVLIMIIAYYLLRNFPLVIEFQIFTGDISKPNPRFNLITAVATFITIIWLDIPTILKKGQLAKQAGIPVSVIRKTQYQLFAETARSATVVGLGAYFITNRIPCAFELSIFTLEIISWLSPLTIDRYILSKRTD